MWSNFEQSPLEDETISNAFSSRGVFVISCDEKVQNYPDVQATVQNKRMVIAIDKSIVLLEDESVAECSFLSFNAHVDCIAISHSGNLIICGLNNGEVHGIHIKGIPLFNLCIKNEDVQITGSTFASIQQLEQSFYLCCVSGRVYGLSEIEENLLESSLAISMKENETIAYDKTLMEHVTINRLSGSYILNDITDAVLIQQPSFTTMSAETVSELLFVAGSHKGLHFCSTAGNDTKINLPERFAGIKHTFNLENYILVLTNSGHLLEVCPFTKTICLSNSSTAANLLIEEIVVMDCTDENIELLVLTKPIDEENRLIKIIEYPSFKCTSELEVSLHSWLVEQPKCSVNLYYLGGHNLNDAQMPQEIEMILVSETHPSERFKKLIAKGYLEEAEDFGKQFELCLQPIFEAKAKRILVELTTLNDNNAELLEQRFTDLLELMQKIENKDFFRQNRMVSISSRGILKRYLNEMLKHFDEEQDESHVLEISEQLHRLETLNLIDPYACNMEWQKFIYNPYLVQMVTALFKTDIPKACLIWKRHACAIIPHLSDEEMKTILNCIPSHTEAFNLLQWLRQFVPTVGGTHPHMMPYITEWIIQKTRALQYSTHWPEIGLEFSTKVAEIFEEIQFMHSDVRRQHERNVAKLDAIVNALQDLSVLQKSYNLIFTLDNYLQDSIDETALCILQRIQLSSLQSLVKDFLYPIFQEKGKTPVAAVRQYISLLVANRNSLSTWLERAVTCIELLHNEDDRLECALLVLQRSPVPWPNTIAPLMKLRYSTHPLALKINTEYEIQVIKIMKVKYGWPADSAADINLNIFMFRIVKMDLPDMLSDIRILTKAAPEISTSANFNCCYQLVRRGKPETAYEIFRSLNAEKNAKYATDIIDLFAHLLENSLIQSAASNVETQMNLIEFFKLIVPHSCASSQKRLLNIQNRAILCHKFRLAINNVSELVSTENRLKFLDLAIANIIERSQATINVSQFISSEMSELCKALQMQKVFGMRRIAHVMHCLPLTCALAYNTLTLVDCCKENRNYFIDLALELISQQMVLYKSKNAASASTTLINDNDTLAFPLAYELLARASLHCSNLQLIELTELLNYMRILNYCYALNAIDLYYTGREKEINESICKALEANEVAFVNSSLNYSAALNISLDVKPNVTKKRYSISIFDEIDVPLEQKTKNMANSNEQIAIVKFLARTLLVRSIETTNSNGIFMKLCELLSDEVKSDIDGAREDFFISLEQLIKTKMHDIWYIMAQYLLDYQKHTKCKIINSDFISLQLNRLFRNEMTHKDVNFTDLFVILIADNNKTTLLEKLSNDLRTDQQKMNWLTLLEMFNSHMEETEKVVNIRSRRLKHYYYMEFCQQDIAIKGKFNSDIDQIDQLLKEFHNKQLNVQLLERMSRDFALDYQQMLVTLVLSILHAQVLQYEIKTNAFGDEELIVLSSVEAIRALCEPYINEIKNIELLTTKLMQFIGEINFYFYELYLCVIEILAFFGTMPKEMQVWTSILHFLKHKMVVRRRNRPCQLETDMWFQSQTEIGVLPKIARYRFPFRPIVEQPLKDILENELSVVNCESWFPLIQMHSVLKGSKDITHVRDFYCMSAVKNSIADYKAKNVTETWHLQPTNNAFLKSILRLIKHVHNPGKAFLLLYFVANYAPDGADQVEATYECHKYALEHEADIIDPKYQQQLIKIKRKYPILKTQHLLYVYGLTDEKLMHLIENPNDLIYNLYHHELILKSSKLDINTVVEEIAELHKLDMEVIQYQLLQKWLAFTMEAEDGTIFEETFFEDQRLTANVANEDSSNATENVVRANYVINSWPKKKAIQFLTAHIFPTDGSINTSRQLQMYECLSKLNDGSASFNNILTQRQYITIKCVHELKQLGYNSSLDKFENCNKIDILKTIWQRNAQNPHTLKVLATICLGFDIYLAKIWNGILKRMVMFNMVRELNAIVDILSCQSRLLNTDGLALAWQYVLYHPFKDINQTRTFAQEELLHKALFRLQSCPVVHKLKLMDFVKQCMLMDRPHIAAVIMALCRHANDNMEIKKLIMPRKNEKLRKEILDLEDAGILPVILNFALKELEL